MMKQATGFVFAGGLLIVLVLIIQSFMPMILPTEFDALEDKTTPITYHINSGEFYSKDEIAGMLGVEQQRDVLLKIRIELRSGAAITYEATQPSVEGYTIPAMVVFMNSAQYRSIPLTTRFKMSDLTDGSGNVIGTLFKEESA